MKVIQRFYMKSIVLWGIRIEITSIGITTYKYITKNLWLLVTLHCSHKNELFQMIITLKHDIEKQGCSCILWRWNDDVQRCLLGVDKDMNICFKHDEFSHQLLDGMYSVICLQMKEKLYHRVLSGIIGE